MSSVKIRGTQKPNHTVKTVLRLLSYMKAFKVLLPLLFFCIILSAGAEVAGAYLLKPAVNNYILPLMGKQNPDLAGFAVLIIKIAGIYAIGAISSFLTQRLLLKISTSTLYKIRCELFNHQSKLSLRYYDSHTHGVLMSLYTNDTDTLRDMFSQSIPQLLTGIFQVAGIFCMMLFLSIPLTAVMVLTVAGIMLLSATVGKKSAKAYRVQQENIGKINGYIEEMIEGQNVVKIFTREEQANRNFSKLNEALCESGTQASTYANILGPIMNNLSHFQYALISILGAVLVITGYMDLGTIASFLQSTREFSRPLSQLSQQFNSILNALAGAERIFAAINQKPEKDNGTVSLVNAYEAKFKKDEKVLVQSFAQTGTWAWHCPELDRLKLLCGDVVFKEVDFSYNRRKRVLNGISLHAKPGQKIALVGSTGSGKTTIANLLTRFYDIEEGSGSITYDGIPLNDIKKQDLRRSIAVVLQDIHLFTGTVLENIRYGNLEATDKQVYDAVKLANADSFIRHLPQGFDTVIKGDGSNLSQGQRQLIAIARAAVANPPVLILDEATSSIDTRTESLIEKGMGQLMRGRTVFVIAHRLSTVRNADCIIVLEEGSIIEQGTHDELLQKHGRYYQLYTGAFELN
ncbi:ATP-binding cassette, subfamily B [Treponema berlinense]|uniref:ATP-binding cassette, subfamily B n=1 Tax=Treponema berlinense TaxID=225004 RepID=A0A1T4L7Z7_9SPIR|nr:ABC transporter ATP-binding protein [Treponema berlinense]MDD5833988.1 ABC transporter ATP-binding protein [Treponema berlinense]SJZ50856.1 ATP-binding cassette, subfamily B [Treponema berlinense]